MGKVILLRHGKRCLGRNYFAGVYDDPLSREGEQQAETAGRWLRKNFPALEKCFTSPAQRCVKTALLAGYEGTVTGDLHEVNLGLFEGKTKEEVRSLYPDMWQAREKNVPAFTYPQGESFETAGLRFMKCLKKLREENKGDLLIVTHSGVIRSFLCLIEGKDISHVFDQKIPEAAMWILDENLRLLRSCFVPPERMVLAEIYEDCQTPDHIIRHMQAVRAAADEIMDRVQYTGDREAVDLAALTHDILRLEKNHALAGAEYLRKLGFDEIALLVAAHESEEENSSEELSGEEILYYADKTVREDKRVSLQERFEASRQKCRSPEALAHHENRLRKALRIEKKIERSIKK